VHRRFGSLPGPPWLAPAAILGLAALLRLVGIRHGLPFPLLDPDEASIVPRAWRMVHGGGLDPHWFDYPSGLMYVLAPFQAWEHEPSYLAARLVVAAFGVGAVAGSWWLGRVAYGRRAGLVAGAAVAVCSLHVAYSHVAVTDVPLTAAIAVSLALAVTGRLEWAGLAAGVATGFKYPGVLLAVPLAVVGFRQLRRLAVSLLLLVAGFAITSPFVFLDPHQAWADASRVNRLARAGWLGFEHDGSAPVAFAHRLWSGLGPVLVIALAGLAIALWRRRRADLVLASFALAYSLTLLPLHAHFGRYVLPLVPPLGALAGRLRTLVPLTLALLVVPLVWSIRDDRTLTKTDTRVAAHAWIEHNLPPGAALAADSSTPPLAGFRVLPLALPGPGRPSDPNRDVARLRRQGIRYVVVTGAVEDRVLAATGDYPRETGFLHALERVQPVFGVAPGNGLVGPWVRVYRLYPSAA
jgi:4-amino-4-deoxy-L-arabinose transferase-like glycosyltransferase